MAKEMTEREPQTGGGSQRLEQLERRLERSEGERTARKKSPKKKSKAKRRDHWAESRRRAAARRAEEEAMRRDQEELAELEKPWDPPADGGPEDAAQLERWLDSEMMEAVAAAIAAQEPKDDDEDDWPDLEVPPGCYRMGNYEVVEVEPGVARVADRGCFQKPFPVYTIAVPALAEIARVGDFFGLGGNEEELAIWPPHRVSSAVLASRREEKSVASGRTGPELCVRKPLPDEKLRDRALRDKPGLIKS